MAFVCQRDSYLKEYKSSVVSVTPSKVKRNLNNTKETLNGYDIIFDNTVLFPEGGGQNSDHGEADGHPVLQVSRRGDLAVHFVPGDAPPFEVGQEVSLKVDWKRRFDNMQQHSGQHLISAFLENLFGNKTTSWWMAENVGNRVGVSSVELENNVTEEQLMEVEERCNEAVRNALNVEVKIYEKNDPALQKAHTRGLPEDFSGPVRVVEMEGVDSNMCCGTHVSNLSHLQVIKLLNVEKAKKGKTNLYFLVGDRVNRYLDGCFKREKSLTEVLQGGADDHVELASKCVKNLKLTQKNCQSVLREMALLEVKHLIVDADPKPKFILKHTKEAEADYANVFVKEAGSEEIFLCLICGDDKLGACQMVITGTEKDVKDLGQSIVKLFDGKGGGKGNRLNAKVSSLKKMDEVRSLLENHFN